MVVRSENFKIQGGTFIGDVYVEANGFNVGKAATVDGNIYFASQEYMDTFVVDETAEVTGTQEVATEGTEEVDVVTTASIVDNGQAVVDGLSADGRWIVATLNDTETDQDIIVEGLFYNKDDESSDIYRKLGLYTQDADHNILEQFTLTAPKMVVRSENFKIQGGTFIGDVYVEANGFNVGKAATVDGNIYFASQEYMDSFVVDETAEVTGTQEVQ
jgi:YHS domain-containing protein